MSDENGTEEEVEYGLRVHVLPRAPFLPLTKEQYETLRSSRDLVRDALGLEEAFHRLLGNFYEYESTLLNEALRFLVFSGDSWSESVGTIHECNRRVTNFLSSARGYLDQTAHIVSGRYGNPSSHFKRLEEWTSHEYDSRLGYRVMEALRNYSQHRGLAVHHLTHDRWADDRTENRVRRNSIVPSIVPNQLREDGGFKSTVLEELEESGEEKLDIRPLAREYLEGLATVHTKLRDEISQEVQAADEAILNAIDRYRREGQDKVIGLAAVKRERSGIYSESVSLFEALIERRRDLERRSRRLTYIAGQYTTNEPKRR